LKANAAPNVALRVLRPGSGSTMTGVATSGVAGFAGPGISPLIATSLPIQVGDAVGLESPMGNLILGVNPGANALTWNMPVLANGETRAADTVTPQREVLVQAVVEPSNTVTFGKPKLNKSNGTAKMNITVPNPGQLSYSGKGIKVFGAASAPAAGMTGFRVKATGGKAKKLRKKGKAGVKVRVTFTPTNGTAATFATKFTLKRDD
jgi:hypothetical protein